MSTFNSINNPSPSTFRKILFLKSMISEKERIIRGVFAKRLGDAYKDFTTIVSTEGMDALEALTYFEDEDEIRSIISLGLYHESLTSENWIDLDISPNRIVFTAGLGKCWEFNPKTILCDPSHFHAFVEISAQIAAAKRAMENLTAQADLVITSKVSIKSGEYSAGDLLEMVKNMNDDTSILLDYDKNKAAILATIEDLKKELSEITETIFEETFDHSVTDWDRDTLIREIDD